MRLASYQIALSSRRSRGWIRTTDLEGMNLASYLAAPLCYKVFELFFDELRIEFAHVFDDMRRVAIPNDRIKFQFVSCLNSTEAGTF